MEVQPIKTKELIGLILESRKLFGTDIKTKNMRHQWIWKTQELMDRGIHLIQTGRFPGKSGSVLRRKTDHI
jgi:hypothetical protein